MKCNKKKRPILSKYEDMNRKTEITKMIRTLASDEQTTWERYFFSSISMRLAPFLATFVSHNRKRLKIQKASYFLSFSLYSQNLIRNIILPIKAILPTCQNSKLNYIIYLSIFSLYESNTKKDDRFFHWGDVARANQCDNERKFKMKKKKRIMT